MKNFIYFSDIAYNYDISPAIPNFHFVNAEFLNDKVLALTMVNQVNNQQNESQQSLFEVRDGFTISELILFIMFTTSLFYAKKHAKKRDFSITKCFDHCFQTIFLTIHFSVFSILVICWAFCLFCFDNF